MVSLTLAVFSGSTPLPGVFSVAENHSAHAAESTILTQQNISYGTSSSEGLVISESSFTEGLALVIENEEAVATPALQGDLPEKELVAMLQEPTPTPTNAPTPTPTTAPTNTPTPAAQSPLSSATATPLPTDTPTPTPPPVAAPLDIEAVFQRFADEFKTDKEQLKRIAKCESGFNAEATNGDYVGMFQYASSSWSSMRSRMGVDTNPDLRRNPEEMIKTAAYHIANYGTGAWPSCK